MKSKEKIIVNDADADVRNSFLLFLNKVGYKTETAQTGQEAVNKIKNEYYNVALLNIKLPDVEGTELIKPLKEKRPNMDVIIMTSNTSLNSVVQALNEGASGNIFKPLNVDNLLTNIKDAIEKKNLIAEKLQTEQKLNESEEKYKNMMNNLDIGFFKVNLDGIYLEHNPEHNRILGIDPFENLIGTKTIDFWQNPKDRQNYLKELKKNGFIKDFIAHAKKKNGEQIVLQANAHLVKNSEGEMTAIEGTFTNITEKYNLEEKLRESIDKFQALFNSNNDSIFIHDKGSQFIEINQTACERLGYTRKELLKLAPKNLVPPGYKVDIQANIKILQEKGELLIESEHMTKDGDVIPVEINSRIFYYGGKNAIISIARDITERRKAEQKIKESEERYRVLFESSPVGIGISDFKGNVYNMNRKLINILGFTEKELNDIKLSSIYADQNERKKLLNILQKYGKVNDYQVRLKHKNGTSFFAQLNFDMIELDGKKLWLTSCEDITERKKTEKIITDLAKFPSENPNPVLRLNNEEVIYANKAGQILFEIRESNRIPMLLNDIVIQTINGNKTKRTEIEVNDHIYSFVLTPIAEEKYVNIYGMDITERKLAAQAIKNRNKEILMLLDASRAVLQYSDFEKAQRMIFKSCNNLIGANAGFVAILNQSKKKYHKIFINPERLSCEVDPDLPMQIRGIYAEVIKTKKTIYHNDFSNSDWIKNLPKGHIQLKNVLIAPLLINDRVEGLMGLTGRKGGFTDEEVRIVTAFTELASISLFNSQTLESLGKSEKKYRTLSNILEQKVEERTVELKESEEKIQNMITNISDVLLEAEPNGIITYISPQVKNLFGYQSEELIGLNFMELIHLEDKNSFKKTAGNALKTKKSVSIECRLKHKKGYYVPISARWIMVKLNNEFKVFGLVSDNTEKKKIDNMIKREIKQLKELDQIRNNLINRISHELNTPLISVLNGSQYLLDSYNDQMSNEAVNIVKMVYQGGYRLKEMVNNLITAYEIETDQIRLKLKHENLTPIVRECVDEIVFQADKRKIFINIELSTELNVNVDRRLIKKAILNLLSNAVKNTLPNGNIFINSVEHHSFIEIIIKDTGVGLTKKEKILIFKKFGKIERFGKGLDVDIEGLGLGLYISSEIVKLHKGEILVKSKGRNKGSTFILRLFLN